MLRKCCWQLTRHASSEHSSSCSSRRIQVRQDNFHVGRSNSLSSNLDLRPYCACAVSQPQHSGFHASSVVLKLSCHMVQEAARQMGQSLPASWHSGCSAQSARQQRTWRLCLATRRPTCRQHSWSGRCRRQKGKEAAVIQKSTHATGLCIQLLQSGSWPHVHELPGAVVREGVCGPLQGNAAAEAARADALCGARGAGGYGALRAAHAGAGARAPGRHPVPMPCFSPRDLQQCSFSCLQLQHIPAAWQLRAVHLIEALAVVSMLCRPRPSTVSRMTWAERSHVISIQASHGITLAPRVTRELWPVIDAVLQRRLRRVGDDVRKSLAVEVDRIAAQVRAMPSELLPHVGCSAAVSA